jgi:hypothetical protein
MRRSIRHGGEDDVFLVGTLNLEIEIRFQGSKHRFRFADGETSANAQVTEFRIRNLDPDCRVPTEFLHDVAKRIAGKQQDTVTPGQLTVELGGGDRLDAWNRRFSRCGKR